MNAENEIISNAMAIKSLTEYAAVARGPARTNSRQMALDATYKSDPKKSAYSSRQQWWAGKEEIDAQLAWDQAKRVYLRYSIAKLPAQLFELMQQDQHEDMRGDLQNLAQVAAREGEETVNPPLRKTKGETLSAIPAKLQTRKMNKHRRFVRQSSEYTSEK